MFVWTTDGEINSVGVDALYLYACVCVCAGVCARERPVIRKGETIKHVSSISA